MKELVILRSEVNELKSRYDEMVKSKYNSDSFNVDIAKKYGKPEDAESQEKIMEYSPKVTFLQNQLTDLEKVLTENGSFYSKDSVKKIQFETQFEKNLIQNEKLKILKMKEEIERNKCTLNDEDLQASKKEGDSNVNKYIKLMRMKKKAFHEAKTLDCKLFNILNPTKNSSQKNNFSNSQTSNKSSSINSGKSTTNYSYDDLVNYQNELESLRKRRIRKQLQLKEKQMAYESQKSKSAPLEPIIDSNTETLTSTSKPKQKPKAKPTPMPNKSKKPSKVNEHNMLKNSPAKPLKSSPQNEKIDNKNTIKNENPQSNKNKDDKEEDKITFDDFENDSDNGFDVDIFDMTKNEKFLNDYEEEEEEEEEETNENNNSQKSEEKIVNRSQKIEAEEKIEIENFDDEDEYEYEYEENDNKKKENENKDKNDLLEIAQGISTNLGTNLKSEKTFTVAEKDEQFEYEYDYEEEKDEKSKPESKNNDRLLKKNKDTTTERGTDSSKDIKSEKQLGNQDEVENKAKKDHQVSFDLAGQINSMTKNLVTTKEEEYEYDYEYENNDDTEKAKTNVKTDSHKAATTKDDDYEYEYEEEEKDKIKEKVKTTPERKSRKESSPKDEYEYDYEEGDIISRAIQKNDTIILEDAIEEEEEDLF
ncbi:hypothetical protein TRFO_16898 [Tritrichomonas foetus]|uniref:Uncharacterized protein n=1 Tax=Tritrichomonas foetus TaxID=1144522 RepID=A0A1J4KPG7_9EUKA|nr:hypothetical protein TRFO_16898 [Tritrichomonas foetus]|eukprot:OHT13131.1 hypothetical protein TRFO_16898 [Tritrichomonas foetus]